MIPHEADGPFIPSPLDPIVAIPLMACLAVLITMLMIGSVSSGSPYFGEPIEVVAFAG